MKTLLAPTPRLVAPLARRAGTHYARLLADLLIFLRRPVIDAPATGLRTAEKTRDTLLLWTVKFPLVLLLSWAVSELKTRGFLPDARFQEFDLLKNPLIALGALVVLAPLVEEALFRSWLKKAHGFVVLLFLIGGEAGVYVAMREAGQSFVPLVFTLLALPVLSLGLWLGRRSVQRFNDWAAGTYRWIFPVVFYLVSVLAFGLMHAWNYELAQVPFWMYPLLCLPQLVAGAFLGYTRLRYGFWLAVLFHAFHNFACWALEFLV